ncbi:hypothetical protein PINS_up016228 [Pythium insidiosum]|nr:hypothetical protein PINS_up016228 [Pythium insidiosum]
MRGRHDAFNYISDYYLASHLQEPLAPYAMPVDFSYYEPDDHVPPLIRMFDTVAALLVLDTAEL